MTIYTVKNAAELTTTYNLAKDGDRIELIAGNYSAVTLQGHQFTQGITIASQDPNARAVFTETLHLFNTSGVTIDGVDVIAGKLANSSSDTRLDVTSSSNINLSDILVQGHIPTASEGVDPLVPGTSRLTPIAGYGYEIGLRINGSQNVTVSDVELQDVRIAAALSNVKNSTLTALNIHDVREGIDMNDILNLVVENSEIHDFKKWQVNNNGDHPDMIQYWGVQSSFGIDGLTIRNNYFHQPAGDFTQTIFGSMHVGQTGLTAHNFVITGNVIVNAQPNGIRLHDVDGVDVSGNILLPNSSSVSYQSYPSIFFGNVTNATVDNNTVMPRWNGSTVLPMTAGELSAAHITLGNNVVMSTNPSSPLYWQTIANNVLSHLPGFTSGSGSGTSGSGTSGSGTSGLNPPTIILDQAHIPAGDTRAVTIGTAHNETFLSSSNGAYVFGNDGNDILNSHNGGDYLVGGAGADSFRFNFRGISGQNDSVIADLNFSEGDVLTVFGDVVKNFDNTTDPSNYVAFSAQLDQVILDSLADIQELVDSGLVTYQSGPAWDSLLLTFAGAPSPSIEILNLSTNDLV